MTIKLSDIIPIHNQKDFKIHIARWNRIEQPLDVFARSREQWKGWQEYRPARDEFSRPYIFSVMHYYTEPDTWLFGGIWKVLDRLPDQYVVELDPQAEQFIGRLKLRLDYRSRATRIYMENYYNDFEVVEIFPEPFSGRHFEGFDQIDLGFSELETIVRNSRPDWQSALGNMKGVYLITDISTGKRYVGSAYGDQGIWSRWCSYIDSGHGGNVELRKLVTSPDLDYCRKNFRFALLEAIPAREANEAVIARESFWKNVLLTRGVYGLNH
ncbi:MAG: hypothetical protein CMN73_04860 [Sphingomonas sp.]|nr:hypothetical protein [Sphingomonas sp.]